MVKGLIYSTPKEAQDNRIKFKCSSYSNNFSYFLIQNSIFSSVHTALVPLMLTNRPQLWDLMKQKQKEKKSFKERKEKEMVTLECTQIF